MLTPTLRTSYVGRSRKELTNDQSPTGSGGSTSGWEEVTLHGPNQLMAMDVG